MANISTTRLTDDQIELITRTIAKGCNRDELELFIGQCNRTGLDPFSRQIYAVKRWNYKEKREEMAVQVSIDGLRLVASRSEQLDGQDGPYWCGEDGQWKDVWLDRKPPLAAKVLVYRRGSTHPYTGVARYSAYVQTKKDGQPNTFWVRMPDVMLAKCAEALALRKAFPMDLSGLYLSEEMQDTPNVEQVAPKQIEHKQPEDCIGPEMGRQVENLVRSRTNWGVEKLLDRYAVADFGELTRDQAYEIESKVEELFPVGDAYEPEADRLEANHVGTS